jgi:SRSO17 transposase
VIFDGSGFPKQGTHSVGVARQYCGAVGKIANCQHGVFAAYVSRKGYTFLDRRLYLPETWFDTAHAPLRQRYGVPSDLTFQTEPQLALAMLDGLVARAEVPFAWVVADEHYGMIPSLLDGIEARHKWYFAEVPTATQVWGGEPQVETPRQGALGRPRKHPRLATGQAKAQKAAQVAAGLPARAWQPYTIKEGSKGIVSIIWGTVRMCSKRLRG